MVSFTSKENWEMSQDSDLFLQLLIVEGLLGLITAVCIATEVSAAFKSIVFDTRTGALISRFEKWILANGKGKEKEHLLFIHILQ